MESCPSLSVCDSRRVQHFFVLGKMYVVDDRRVPVDGGEILARVVRPVGQENETFPVLVWYHGGGER